MMMKRNWSPVKPGRETIVAAWAIRRLFLEFFQENKATKDKENLCSLIREHNVKEVRVVAEQPIDSCYVATGNYFEAFMSRNRAGRNILHIVKR